MMKSIVFLKHGFGYFGETRKIGPARWNHFDLLFIHDGKVMLTVADQKEMHITGPSAILIYPNTLFSGSSLSSISRASVQYFALTESLNNNYPFKLLANRNNGYISFTDPAFCRRIEPMIVKAVKLASVDSDDFVYNMRVHYLGAILSELFYQQMQYGNKENAVGNDFAFLLTWLEQNLDKRISLSKMALKMNISISHFRMRFTRELGCSPGKYLMNLRIDKAAALLRETALPVKEISMLVGYEDVSHFYRAFGSHFKTTPGNFRKINAIIG